MRLFMETLVPKPYNQILDTRILGIPKLFP